MVMMQAVKQGCGRRLGLSCRSRPHELRSGIGGRGVETSSLALCGAFCVDACAAGMCIPHALGHCLEPRPLLGYPLVLWPLRYSAMAGATGSGSMRLVAPRLLVYSPAPGVYMTSQRACCADIGAASSDTTHRAVRGSLSPFGQEASAPNAVGCWPEGHFRNVRHHDW